MVSMVLTYLRHVQYHSHDGNHIEKTVCNSSVRFLLAFQNACTLARNAFTGMEDSGLLTLGQVATAVAEDGVYLLMGQVERGLEEPSRRRGAAGVVTHFCRSSRLDFQEHVPQLISVRLLPACVSACACGWEAQEQKGV